MPDILSRIKLEATGADQVLRDLDRIRQGMDAVSSSGAGMGIGGGGAARPDPFASAVAAGGTGAIAGAGVSHMERVARRAQENQDVANRESAHRQSTAGGANIIRSGTGAAVNLGRGNIMEAGEAAAGTAGGMLGGMGALAAIPWVMGAGAVMGAVGKLAGSEWERVQSIYGRGTGQRLGMGYETARNTQLELMRSGIYQSNVEGYMEGLGRAGGTYDPTMSVRNMARAQTYGIDAGTAGTFEATLRRAGGTGEINQDLYGVMEKTFGTGRLGPVFQQMGQIMEEAMARGATSASMILRDGGQELGNTIAALAQFGGLSLEGAVQTARAMISTGAGAANLRSATDVMAMRAFRGGLGANERGGLFETRLQMVRDPLRAANAQYDMYNRMYGGNRNMIGEALIASGYSIEQAGAIIDARSAGRELTAEEFRATNVGDVAAELSIQARQQNMLSGVEESLNNFINNLTLSLAGAPEAVQELVEEVNKNMEEGAKAQEDGNVILRGIYNNTLTTSELMEAGAAGAADIVRERESETQPKNTTSTYGGKTIIGIPGMPP